MFLVPTFQSLHNQQFRVTIDERSVRTDCCHHFESLRQTQDALSNELCAVTSTAQRKTDTLPFEQDSPTRVSIRRAGDRIRNAVRSRAPPLENSAVWRRVTCHGMTPPSSYQTHQIRTTDSTNTKTEHLSTNGHNNRNALDTRRRFRQHRDAVVLHLPDHTSWASSLRHSTAANRRLGSCVVGSMTSKILSACAGRLSTNIQKA